MRIRVRHRELTRPAADHLIDGKLVNKIHRRHNPSARHARYPLHYIWLDARDNRDSAFSQGFHREGRDCTRHENDVRAEGQNLGGDQLRPLDLLLEESFYGDEAVLPRRTAASLATPGNAWDVAAAVAGITLIRAASIGPRVSIHGAEDDSVVDDENPRGDDIRAHSLMRESMSEDNARDNVARADATRPSLLLPAPEPLDFYVGAQINAVPSFDVWIYRDSDTTHELDDLRGPLASMGLVKVTHEFVDVIFHGHCEGGITVERQREERLLSVLSRWDAEQRPAWRQQSSAVVKKSQPAAAAARSISPA